MPFRAFLATFVAKPYFTYYLTVIRCEPAYALNNAVMNSTGINYLSTAQYRCLSGYIMYGRSTLTATCNQSATWEMEGEELEESSSGCQSL